MTDRHARGKIRLKFMTCVETKRRNSRRDSLYLQFLVGILIGNKGDAKGGGCQKGMLGLKVESENG